MVTLIRYYCVVMILCISTMSVSTVLAQGRAIRNTYTLEDGGRYTISAIVYDKEGRRKRVTLIVRVPERKSSGSSLVAPSVGNSLPNVVPNAPADDAYIIDTPSGGSGVGSADANDALPPSSVAPW